MSDNTIRVGQTVANEHWDKAIKRSLRKMRSSDYMVETIEWNEQGNRITLTLAPTADVRHRWRARFFS
jgi:hypothetical protein